jgi:hypothetical protein
MLIRQHELKVDTSLSGKLLYSLGENRCWILNLTLGVVDDVCADQFLIVFPSSGKGE